MNMDTTGIIHSIFKWVTVFVCSIFTIPALAQLKSAVIYLKKDVPADLCSDKFVLDSSGNFFEIRGCENKQTAAMGLYQLNNGVINFKYKDVSYFKPILRKEESAAENDTLVKITFLDCLGKPIPAQFEIDAIETSGKYFTPVRVNEKGEIFLNPNKYSSLRLTELNHYYAGWKYIDVKHNNQKVYLHLPQQIFQLTHPLVWFFTDFSVLYKADGLYDLEGKSIVFSREKE